MRKFAWIIATCAVYLTFLTSAQAQGEQGAQPSGNNDSRNGNRWVMPSKNYAGTRFSRLNKIDQDNVDQLQIAWVFSTGVLRGHEAAPLVVGDTMYIVTPFPNILYALDLTNDGAIKWIYKPHPNPSAQGVAKQELRRYSFQPSQHNRSR